MKVLITGSSGRLGKAVKEIFEQDENYQVFAPRHDELERYALSKRAPSKLASLKLALKRDVLSKDAPVKSDNVRFPDIM